MKTRFYKPSTLSHNLLKNVNKEFPIFYNVATEQTLGFVKEHITVKNAKVLEVGCGKGHLSEEMMRYGYQVTAIDLSEGNVAAAKEKGVNAEVADVLQYTSEQSFDAVLFSRSFHHIASLETVLNTAKKLLNDSGRILIEDFAVEQMDLKTANWFYGLEGLLSALAGKNLDGQTSVGEDALTRWKKEHTSEHPIHTRKDIVKVMEKNFGNINSSTVPYLYRYFIENVSAVTHGAEALQKIFEWESKAIENKLIEPIGFRIVAKKYFSYLR